jgi:chromosome segregation ATPase
MKHIQASRQLTVEYKEKIRILQNEVEVLRQEFQHVDEAVRLQKNEFTSAFKRRDATRSDLKRAELKYKETQTQIDFQSNELRRLNRVLGDIEESIARSQKLYDNQASDCSDIQKMLIDKRDELCIIEEQFSRHEWVMRRGEASSGSGRKSTSCSRCS